MANRIAATRIAGFTLTLFDGKHGYDARLTHKGREIGWWRDFNPSPLHAVDSVESWESLWNFVTLRPGDTDSEYFADYTPAMMQFAEVSAEAVAWEAIRRFNRELATMV